jgi:hypothetical protein
MTNDFVRCGGVITTGAVWNGEGGREKWKEAKPVNRTAFGQKES